jgi:hypothetical protein
MMVAIDPGTYSLSMACRPDDSVPKDFRIRLAGTLTMGVGRPAFALGEGSDIPQCIGSRRGEKEGQLLTQDINVIVKHRCFPVYPISGSKTPSQVSGIAPATLVFSHQAPPRQSPRRRMG